MSRLGVTARGSLINIRLVPYSLQLSLMVFDRLLIVVESLFNVSIHVFNQPKFLFHFVMIVADHRFCMMNLAQFFDKFLFENLKLMVIVGHCSCILLNLLFQSFK